MTKFKISAQSHIIADVIQHLNFGMTGMGIARSWNYEVIKNTIYFTLKEGCEVNPEDLFWFGYLTKD